MSKKAVVKVLGHQYLVSEGEVITVDLLPEDTKKLDLEALLVIDGDKTTVGTPVAAKVVAEVVEPKVAGEKIRVIRYKAKKRVHKEMGHRQKYSTIKITKIA
ncbi:50S ribosomal protein L21 [Candidatus Saccharibacteria bacterium]|nr:50S ribosomal protein L21 [Candidatus Saccharibacteria bacterium]